MAIAHVEVRIFSRGKGHSAVAKAAYRAGESLHDARLGLTWNYTKKRHVEGRFILAPDGAPAWVFEREHLWNTVETHETRATAQLARELEISLPRELTPTQQEALLRSFIAEHFVSKGMVADCAIHRPPAKPRQALGLGSADQMHDNPHAHVMLTMRELTPTGFGNKRRDWNDWDLKNETRRHWELAANHALALAGHRERIDMRSFEDRGVALTPQPRRCRTASEALSDGRDVVHAQHAKTLEVARENGERILARPEVVLELLGSRQSTFTERDILRALNRYTADAEQFTRVRCAVFASSELVRIPSDCGDAVYSTRATVQAERSLLVSAHNLARRAAHLVPEGTVSRAITGSARALRDEQASAVRHLTMSGDLALVEGYAGAGKSTMLAAARAAWVEAGYEVVGGALAGKAAEGLADATSAGIPSRTLAAWEWAWTHGRQQLTSRHVLVIDEAGMVGTKQLERVLAAARDAGAKVVLVGDTRQLQAIEPGAPMRVLCAQYGASKLTDVIRQRDHQWQAEATRLFGEGQAKEALLAYVNAGRTHAHATADDAQRALVDRWSQERAESPADTSILLAYRRKDVAALNALARTVRREAGELGEDHTFATRNGQRSFAQGDRIYFLKNDRTLGVTNGTLATIEAINGSTVTARLDDHRQVTFDVGAYGDIDHGYAATVHKAQGVTVQRAYVLASRYLDASATYVALSRHQKDVQLFYAESEFGTRDALVAKLSRARVSRMALEKPSPLPEPARLARELREEQEFLALSPEAQLARLDKLKDAGERPSRSAAEVFELLPDVQVATSAQREAAARVAVAEEQLAQFAERHPFAYELRTAKVVALESSVESARAALLHADSVLSAVRNNPERRAAAVRIASRHNTAIKFARERWRFCNELKARQARDSAIARYADAYNAQRGDRAFRAATRTDEGKTFEVLRKSEVLGQPVYVLRARSGSLVLADASLFPQPPIPGTSAVLVGRQRKSPTLEKGLDHGNDRSRGFD